MISMGYRPCMKISMWNLLKYFSPKILNHSIKEGSYSHIIMVSKFINLTRLSSTSVNYPRLQHNEIQNKFKDKENFHNILKLSEEYKGNLSVNQIMSIVDKMDSMLKEISMEYHHKKKLQNTKEFKNLFSEIQNSFDDISIKDLIKILSVFASLDVVVSKNVFSRIEQKIKSNAENMDLADKIYLMKLIIISKKEENVYVLKDDLNKEIRKDLKTKSYTNSPSNIIALLDFVSFLSRKVHEDDAINTLKLVLDLKQWDDKLIYKNYLSALRHVPSHQDRYLQLLNRFLERVENEFSKRKDVYLMCSFLMAYAESVSENRIGYDENVVDRYVNRILEGDLKTRAIKYLCIVLSDIRHTHYNFTNYLIDFIEKNPTILSSHPYLSSKIITTIARSNCNHEESNRYGRIQTILQDSPHLTKMLKQQSRHSLVQYIHLMLHLSSLGVFCNDEWKYLSDYINQTDIEKHSVILLLLLVHLNHVTKVLHPNCPHQILNNYFLRLISKKFDQSEPSGNYLTEIEQLERIRKYLIAASNVNNCMLIKCKTKSSFSVDGVLGVTKEGNFFNFREYMNKQKTVYIEDISLPEAYHLVTLVLVFEKEHSRNALNLNAMRASSVQVYEKSGYIPVIIYCTLWDRLSREKKGDYLYRTICDTVKQKIKINQ